MAVLSIPQIIAVAILPVMFAITVHEVAHGWVASLFGDQTARLSGRLTLNPIPHIDLIGTIVVPLILIIFSNAIFGSSFIFGWAKPVPVDARNMRNPRWNMAVVAAAGPISNLLMAIFWACIAKVGVYLYIDQAWVGDPLLMAGQIGVWVNVVLFVLNLIPIPPLDGGRVVSSLLPGRLAWQLLRFERYSFFIVMILILTGIFSYVISPPIILLNQSIITLFGLPALDL